jgi:hypothetical protein
VGYVVWSAAGDVRAATVARTGSAFATLAAPLDINPGADAGSGSGRPQVAASADGTALAAWGENGHVYARRVLHLGLSQVPQDLNVATLAGHTGGTAEGPEVDISDDSSFAWVAFRQAFDNNARQRVLVRQLIGSAFDPPRDVGPGGFAGESAGSPALDVAGGGDAIFAAEGATTHAVEGALFYLDRLGPAIALSGAGAVPAQPAVAVGENSQATAAWFEAGAVQARAFKRGKSGDPTATVSDPGLGPVDTTDGLVAGSERLGNTVIAFIQGVGAARRVVVALWDRPPTSLLQTTTIHWRRPKPLSWAGIDEPWGTMTYAVYVDGRSLGTTTLPTLPIAGRVGDGLHFWRVTATDQRGQTVSSIRRSLRIDTAPPRLSVAITGKRKAGTSLKIHARAVDRRAGLRFVKVVLGDGSAAVYGSVVRHRYPRGSWSVQVTAVDKAGNVRVLTRRITVR